MRALVVAAVVLFAVGARAADPPPAPPTSEAQREARTHYERGMTHYQLGDFARAVEEFKQAYALTPAPGLLFNLAQASRLGKQHERALYFYRTYLRIAPDAGNRSDVEQRIADLETIVAAEEKQRLDNERHPQVAPAPAATEPATLARKSAPTTNGRGLRIGGIVVGVLGLAALGAGVGLSVDVISVQSDLDKLRSTMGTWTQAQADRYGRGQNEANAATALYIAGGVAVATGIVLYVVGHHYGRSARYAQASAATWTF
jgi:tetratricopeptide (TPR) repeat protein